MYVLVNLKDYLNEKCGYERSLWYEMDRL